MANINANTSSDTSSLTCWQCQASISSVPLPISRHATCDACGYELHVCRLCSHYRADETSRCWEDRAEVPNNKEVANFCEFFSPTALSADGPSKSSDLSKADAAKAELEALFGKADE